VLGRLGLILTSSFQHVLVELHCVVYLQFSKRALIFDKWKGFSNKKLQSYILKSLLLGFIIELETLLNVLHSRFFLDIIKWEIDSLTRILSIDVSCIKIRVCLWIHDASAFNLTVSKAWGRSLFGIVSNVLPLIELENGICLGWAYNVWVHARDLIICYGSCDCISVCLFWKSYLKSIDEV